MNNLWIKLTASLMLIVIVGVGAWAVIDKLEADTFKLIVGVLLTLFVVVIVGGLFIGKDLLQAYIIRRAIQQDDLSDMKQMAFIMRLMGGNRPPNVNVRMPNQQGGWLPMLMQGGQQNQQQFDGAYRDTTIGQEIEVE